MSLINYRENITGNKMNFLRELDRDYIKINWNKKPIKMEQFLGFLTVPTERFKGDYLGKCTGWTKIVGDNNLIITGGIVGGVEYLDHIEYREKMNDPYSNYVNPFHIFEILSDSGKAFFRLYYKDQIDKVIKKYSDKVSSLEWQLEQAKNQNKDCENFFREIGAL